MRFERGMKRVGFADGNRVKDSALFVLLLL